MSDDLVKQAMAELTDVVRCRCNEAYTGRGLRDPDCQCDSAEAAKVVADRIEELEAKLAKAVEKLEDMQKVPRSDASHGILMVMIKHTLAELKGEK